MKTTFQCKKCQEICCEIQLPGDEQERDLDLCEKCNKKLSFSWLHENDKQIFKKG